MNSINKNINKLRLEIPILIIAFNRPKLTQKLLKSIKLLKPSKIYVAADGPRNNNINDLDSCNHTRKLFETEINWECELKKKFRPSNVGVKKNINEALDWFFTDEEMGIIIEDDCEVNQSFFKFCEELLIKYKINNKIKAISGNYYFTNSLKNSYYFSRCPGTHGWATWKRAWQENDIEMKRWSPFADFIWLLFYFKFDIVKAHYFYKKFSHSYESKINSWDYQFLYSIWKSNGLIIRPFKSLSKHIGWGDDATHSKGVDRHPDVQLRDMKFPIEHPKDFKINSKLDNLEIKITRNVRFVNYILYKIKNKFL